MGVLIILGIGIMWRGIFLVLDVQNGPNAKIRGKFFLRKKER